MKHISEYFDKYNKMLPSTATLEQRKAFLASNTSV